MSRRFIDEQDKSIYFSWQSMKKRCYNPNCKTLSGMVAGV